MTECDYCHGVGACPKCWGRAAIEELKRRVAGLEAALKAAEHACGCKRLNPPVPTGCPPCDLLRAALASPASALDEALRRERERLLAIVDSEPEMPGDPTDEQRQLFESVHPDALLRMTVRATKQSIRRRIEALAIPGTPNAGGER